MVDCLVVVVPLLGLSINVPVQTTIFRLFPRIGLLKTVYFGFAAGLLFVLLGDFYLYKKWTGEFVEGLFLFLHNFLVYTALGYCYFFLIILGETARRIRIIREIHDSEEGLSQNDLLDRYNAREMVAMRLNRLLHNGQIVLREGRLYIGKPVVLWISKLILFLKVLVLRRESERISP